MTRLTVAIPFFNEERHLGTAIRSILGQTFADYELLLIDDGSTDGSLAVAHSFEDARIRVLADGRRRHLPARLNEVARLARGDLIARMDGDDVAHPTRLAKQVALLEGVPDVAGVGSWIALIDESEQVLAVVEAGNRDASARVALEHGLLAHATFVARREWLLANAYDEQLTRTEDRDLWCRTVDRARFSVIPEVLYLVRVEAHDKDFVQRYVESQRQHRALLLRHGPRILGPVGTANAWVRSHGKSVVVRAAARVGTVDSLVRRRGRPATEAEHERVVEALQVSARSA